MINLLIVSALVLFSIWWIIFAASFTFELPLNGRTKKQALRDAIKSTWLPLTMIMAIVLPLIILLGLIGYLVTGSV